VDGVPILLAPEMLVSSEGAELIDTDQDPYREAYEEMDFYNAEAASAHSDIPNSDAYQIVSTVVNAGSFSGPEWLDAKYDIASQADGYQFMSPMKDMTALQLGGSGIHAVKFLLAGAGESWLLTPMLGEAIFARELAVAFGVKDRFRSVVGIAEEIPFRDSGFDRVYSGGCIHHTITERVFPEIRRVLKPGGKFAAIEPWRAPMYRAGIKFFGKQERGVNCRPMELERVLSLFQTFDNATMTHHGTFTRYPLIALGKLGLRLRFHTIDRITQFDDNVASKYSLRKYGSSVALLAESTG
jgi:SAM-dependent methyltransferase